MFENFINRETELKTLNDEYYNGRTGSFVVIYGRRRTGKTTLIKKFIEDKDGVYFLADMQNEKLQLERFKEILSLKYGDDSLKYVEINKWDFIFDYIISKLSPAAFGDTPDKTNNKHVNKHVIVIDEFQYLSGINAAIASIFQRLWDEKLKDKNVMLILCGSLVSLMYSLTLNYSSPLYGRRTAQINLKSLSFLNIKHFLKNKNADELLQYYSIFGGIPKYLELINPDLDIFENVKKIILSKDAFLYNEPLFLLKDEINEISSYFSILRVISQGDNKIGNIAAKLGLRTNNLTFFMEKLIELEIIERKVPVTEENPSKSKKGLYFIRDNFFKFWFRYVLPNQVYLETDNYEPVLIKIKETFNQYVSFIFEDAAQEILIKEDLPFDIIKSGRWWDKNDEIDIIACGKNEILFGECKYWNDPAGLNVITELQRKSEKVNYPAKERYYAVFSKSGFTEELLNIAEKNQKIRLYDLRDF